MVRDENLIMMESLKDEDIGENFGVDPEVWGFNTVEEAMMHEEEAMIHSLQVTYLPKFRLKTLFLVTLINFHSIFLLIVCFNVL